MHRYSDVTVDYTDILNKMAWSYHSPVSFAPPEAGCWLAATLEGAVWLFLNLGVKNLVQPDFPAQNSSHCSVESQHGYTTWQICTPHISSEFTCFSCHAPGSRFLLHISHSYTRPVELLSYTERRPGPPCWTDLWANYNDLRELNDLSSNGEEDLLQPVNDGD